MSEKEEAENKFVDISKAYRVLTDEEARKLYEETGNPDGTQANTQMGLALPQWLIDKDNNFFVLFIYTVLFGIGLPFAVVRFIFGHVVGSLVVFRQCHE
jgi:translocation protein SEC63